MAPRRLGLGRLLGRSRLGRRLGRSRVDARFAARLVSTFVQPERIKVIAVALAVGAFALGCSSSPAPQPATPPPGGERPPTPESGFTGSGAEDSAAALLRSTGALYRFRFKQLQPPAERFNFQDRDLSFYFKPAPSALFIQVENRQNRQVWIEWDRSTFYPPRGSSGKVAHASTRWQDRFRVQAPTQIGGLQRYSDQMLPLDYLLDPAGSSEQLHRPFLPEDATAPQFENSEFGVDLVFRIEDRFRTYSFRFRVESVIPR